MRNSLLLSVTGLAASAVLTSVPAQAEVVQANANAFVVRDEATVSADKRAVWLALIAPAKWWNEAHTFSGDSANLSLMPKANGCFCERIPGTEDSGTVRLEGSVEHMRVILALPDQALRMQGALGPLQSEPVNGVMTVTLSEAPEGTRITFEYAVDGYMRFEVPVVSKAVDNVISQQLRRLAQLLGPLGESAAESEDAVSETGEMDDEPRSVDDAFGNLGDDQ